ncbi:hypothetical protein LCGC14_0256610 [marine sediment metagenome]|uniref:Uncharacterized protein n=1 Tax=marine sediment metagenome TaxID=412755 RepID=A0A0F9UJS0_9ZZZZ
MKLKAVCQALPFASAANLGGLALPSRTHKKLYVSAGMTSLKIINTKQREQTPLNCIQFQA